MRSIESLVQFGNVLHFDIIVNIAWAIYKIPSISIECLCYVK